MLNIKFELSMDDWTSKTYSFDFLRLEVAPRFFSVSLVGVNLYVEW